MGRQETEGGPMAVKFGDGAMERVGTETGLGEKFEIVIQRDRRQS